MFTAGVRLKPTLNMVQFQQVSGPHGTAGCTIAPIQTQTPYYRILLYNLVLCKRPTKVDHAWMVYKAIYRAFTDSVLPEGTPLLGLSDPQNTQLWHSAAVPPKRYVGCLSAKTIQTTSN